MNNSCKNFMLLFKTVKAWPSIYFCIVGNICILLSTALAINFVQTVTFLILHKQYFDLTLLRILLSDNNTLLLYVTDHQIKRSTAATLWVSISAK